MGVSLGGDLVRRTMDVLVDTERAIDQTDNIINGNITFIIQAPIGFPSRLPEKLGS
jgi:hypothetical protein